MISVIAERDIAIESPDHLYPRGTQYDNSYNHRFNDRLLTLLQPAYWSVLDLGCAGGGFVKTWLDRGFLAVGIEGSDFSKIRKRAEWATIPGNLFTADITAPFRVETHGIPLRFGCVTLWEVIEHIAEPDLPGLFRNIDANLKPGGIVLMSISHNAEVVGGHALHQTVQPREWWDSLFNRLAWVVSPLVEHFSYHFVRGGSDAPGSTHALLHRKGEKPAIQGEDDAA